MPGNQEGEPPAQARDRSSDFDFQRISRTVDKLEASGWYWGAVNGKEAMRALRDQKEGTFLVRDSEDSAHLFSVSVKTPLGATSVRIKYTQEGNFSLDSGVKNRCPEFDCVVKLLDYYMRESAANAAKHFWKEPEGRRRIPLILSRPLVRKVPDLQHLCRRAINAHTPAGLAWKLPLPGRLKNFVTDYPFSF
ncbi:PREDICTED: suppressor of cytokine signaling 2-like [Branchiostoma belcheri]|uniref:Suppressor of cytokine signaling 2-like n=1 Tax=Branchiostoma belcheri TaxID=7741 RepID=A0A6P5ADI8_BRABE|nr:PREDICTED: suppressor of cytokine signaling 2-like [Branchiostoma belcheri]KAI8498526.1 JAK pathway signal transduction adaptor [Branchiostoma belcheri]